MVMLPVPTSNQGVPSGTRVNFLSVLVMLGVTAALLAEDPIVRPRELRADSDHRRRGFRLASWNDRSQSERDDVPGDTGSPVRAGRRVPEDAAGVIVVTPDPSVARSRNTIAAKLSGLCLAALAMFAISATAQSTPPVPRSGPQTINPGELWPDNRGQHIQAHGGGIIKYQGLYYWFGEQRGQDVPLGQRAVSCYSSSDLVHWTFRRTVFTMSPADRPVDLPGTGIVLERPKVFYNAKTKTFVMYVHLDDMGYRAAEAGVATSEAVDGDYKLIKHFRPLGQESRDIGQFIDDDGTAYLIFEDRPNGWHIAKLSDDYLSIERDVHLFPEHMEGGALVHLDGLYYAIGSHLTGWNANPNLYATAKSLEGPWSEFKDIAPPESKTYGSQSTMLIKVVGTRSTTVIFMGDIWRPRTQWDSRYLWMPLEIGDGKLVLPEPRPWTLDIATGEAVVNKQAPAMVLPPPAPRGGPGGGAAPAPPSTSPANP